MDIKTALARIAARENLADWEMRDVMTTIMAGEATPSQIGAFLMGMRLKGETVEEIAAAVAILREKMVPVEAPDDAMDIVGTGGDGAGTLNISTAAAFVVAATGQTVAKHGNRALSSKSGSAEVLRELGINIDIAPDEVSRTIREAGIGFMFAPSHHPALRHVGPSRMELGMRTMFNLLGPQSNPAGCKRYLLGVYAREWVEPVAQALLANGCVSAWVVHGSDGLDEMTTAGTTYVTQVRDGEISSFEVRPEDVGLKRVQTKDLKGGSPEFNAKAMKRLFDGEMSPYRDVVLLNAAGALVAAGRAANLHVGLEIARRQIDFGLARAKLRDLVDASNGLYPDAPPQETATSPDMQDQ